MDIYKENNTETHDNQAMKQKLKSYVKRQI